MKNKLVYFFSVFSLFSCSKKNLIPNPIESNVKNITIEVATNFVGPCEPSISINPKNKKHIVGGSVLNNVYYSHDGGKKWHVDKISSSHGVYGDPVVRYLSNGSVLYAHLSNPENKAFASDSFLDKIVVQKSNDNGKTWSDGSFPKVNASKDHDKHWLATGENDGEVIMTWTEFDSYGSKDKNCTSKILFSKSMDYGDTWTDAVTINQFYGDCIDSDGTTEGAVPAIGVKGEYYVAWALNDKIYLDISKDKGKSWLAQDLVIADQIGGWDIDIPGIGRANGMPITEVDHSHSPYRGTIYVNWSDQRNGDDNTDIWLVKSSDGGESWSQPIKVNDDDTNRHQFFSWMDVDPKTGYIYIVF
ncbi:MAG TPA: sialidase family protein, partial [Saprospiraceae bacterium]|nr:sialidase family protein [Saprospiraceae bacterium]